MDQRCVSTFSHSDEVVRDYSFGGTMMEVEVVVGGGGVAFRVTLALLVREAVKNGGRGRGFSFL